MDKGKFLAEKLKDGLKEHEIMRDHTTMKVGGVADFYYEAKTVKDLIKAVNAARKINLPYFVLGWGSNIIFSDYGFPGLIIKNATDNISFMNEKSQVIADAGIPLSKLILEATSKNLSGLEFLYGIPGTIGGAIYGNAGAYGQSIGDFVREVTVLLVDKNSDKEPEITQRPAEWLNFAYRSSYLKKMSGSKKPIILTIKFQLAQNRQEEIIRRLKSYQEKRMDSQPVGSSAGCVFKNPIPEELKDFTGSGTVNMPALPKERTAGYMLDKAGAKKIKIGGAKVSPKHANFILNFNNAKAQDVRQVVEKMRDLVKAKFEIELKEEIEYIGQW